jgi:hypothetical protein
MQSRCLLSLGLYEVYPENVITSIAKAQCFPLIKQFHINFGTGILDAITLSPLSACSEMGDFIFNHANSLENLDVRRTAF